MNKLWFNHHNLEYPVLRQFFLDSWNGHPGGITDGQLRFIDGIRDGHPGGITDGQLRFIDGILRCKGPARAIDQVAMQAETGLVIEPSVPWGVTINQWILWRLISEKPTYDLIAHLLFCLHANTHRCKQIFWKMVRNSSVQHTVQHLSTRSAVFTVIYPVSVSSV